DLDRGVVVIDASAGGRRQDRTQDASRTRGEDLEPGEPVMTTENQQQEQTVENQQQDPATAAQDAAAARGAKALDTMYPEAWRRLQKARESLPPGGRVYSSPGAAALAEAEMTPPSPEEQARETRRLELLRNPAYLDGNHKDHAKVM